MTKEMNASDLARHVMTSAIYFERQLTGQGFFEESAFLNALGTLALKFSDLSEPEQNAVLHYIKHSAKFPIPQTVPLEVFLNHAGNNFYALPKRTGTIFRSSFVNGKAVESVNVSGFNVDSDKEPWQTGQFISANCSQQPDLNIGKSETTYFESDLTINEKNLADGKGPARQLLFALANLGGTVEPDDDGINTLYFGPNTWIQWLCTFLFGLDPKDRDHAARDTALSVLAHCNVPLGTLFKQRSWNLAAFETRGKLLHDAPYLQGFESDEVSIVNASTQVMPVDAREIGDAQAIRNEVAKWYLKLNPSDPDLVGAYLLPYDMLSQRLRPTSMRCEVIYF